MQIKSILLFVVFSIGTSIATTAPALAQDKESPFHGLLLRGRALAVIPQSSADISGIGGDTELSNSYVPELDVTWFFTPNIAVEAIAAVSPHDVEATGTSIGNVDLGSVWLLPPTVLVQYHHPLPHGFKPYVGAGINYTVFFDEDAPGGTVTNIDYENSFGWALQVGIDYMLDDHWLLNLDVKKLFLNTDVSLNNGAIRADVDINPWIVGVGVGYRF